MLLYINCIREEQPGPKWKEAFDSAWPYYKKWFLSEGFRARPGYVSSRAKISQYMPELLDVYDTLAELAGGGDLEARFLSQYCPPPYISGCSQIAWNKDALGLIRNYDYSPTLFEGVLTYTCWKRPVISMSECSWGVLDGMNDAGLCVSLTFGGTQLVGEGFGIPLILRYVLETADTVAQAKEIFNKVPVHMTYNVTVLDAAGNYTTVYLNPFAKPDFTDSPIGTNHQKDVQWEAYANLTATLERESFLKACHADQSENLWSVFKKFLKPPLYNTRFERGFGTLYTALYRPDVKKLYLRWLKKNVEFSFTHFPEDKIIINLGQGFSGKSIL